jgi:hypothetical protein
MYYEAIFNPCQPNDYNHDLQSRRIKLCGKENCPPGRVDYQRWTPQGPTLFLSARIYRRHNPCQRFKEFKKYSLCAVEDNF